MTPWAASRAFVQEVRADYAQVIRYRAKYQHQQLSAWRLPVDLIQKIGFQQMVAIRLMGAVRRAGVPLAPQVLSRLIRHLYGADVHWDAQLSPGLSLVHGIGLVVGHGAKTAPGCILFQHVTLGEGIDPVSRRIGAPELGEDVHVGPGATLLGPITVGRGSKVMAGAVLTVSVPDESLVAPGRVQITARAARPEVRP